MASRRAILAQKKESALQVIETYHPDVVSEEQTVLERSFCLWPGDWTSFANAIVSKGSPLQGAIVSLLPEEFGDIAERRRTRGAEYVGTRIFDYIKLVEDMATGASKIDLKTGSEVSDNPVRLQALRMLLELGALHRKKSFSPAELSSPRTSGDSVLSVIRMAKEKGLKVVATERQVSLEQDSDAGDQNGTEESGQESFFEGHPDVRKEDASQ